MKRKSFFRGIGIGIVFILCMNMTVPVYASMEPQEETQMSSEEQENENESSATDEDESEIKDGMQQESPDSSSQEVEVEIEDSEIGENQDELAESDTDMTEDTASIEESEQQGQDNSLETQSIPSENQDAITEDMPDSGEASTNDNGISTYFTNRTQSEAIQWVKSQVGKSLDMDGAYGAQCVDLILAYYDYLGVPRASGNGADYTWNSLPRGWQRLQGAAPQPGDILVYTGGYGHVAIYESDYSTYHQNFDGHSYVERITYRYNGLSNPYWGVIRPDWNSNTQASITFSNDDCQWDTTNAYIYTKANASFRGTFTEAGMTIWDTSGKEVASKKEYINTNGSYLEIWYNITNDTGVKLISGQRYNYQFYTVFNGTRFNGPQKTFITNSITPSNVTGLKATAVGKNKVRLSWNIVSGANGYLIYAHKNGKYAYCGMSSSNAFIDKKALDTEYNFYWVFAYVKNSDGKIFPGGCQQYVYAKGIIPAVLNLKATSVKGGVKLSWSKRAEAVGYLVYGRRAGGKYEYIGMTTMGTSFTDKKASKTKYNYYWVYPYHKNGNKMVPGGVPKYTYGRAR